MEGRGGGGHRSSAAATTWVRQVLADPYARAAFAIFAFTVVRCWTSVALGHEVLYLIGSRRVFDPSFLAHDFTWSSLPPTSFLFDHMLAPLWRFFGEFADKFSPDSVTEEFPPVYFFSDGRQSCAGESLVTFLLKAALAQLLAKFRFELVAPGIAPGRIPYLYDHFGIKLRIHPDG